ncbi:hypothetical protein B0H14DRAFT_2574444 [Mycena olivaceomarginata]|nr:hypothetical protein B0H14DRAFT_2574444 [Mycena olivaceomarginata]
MSMPGTWLRLVGCATLTFARWHSSDQEQKNLCGARGTADMKSGISQISDVKSGCKLQSDMKSRLEGVGSRMKEEGGRKEGGREEREAKQDRVRCTLGPGQTSCRPVPELDFMSACQILWGLGLFGLGVLCSRIPYHLHPLAPHTISHDLSHGQVPTRLHVGT